MLIQNTEAPQGYVLRPFLYSLFTRDSETTHILNSIITFADETTEIMRQGGGEVPGGMVSEKSNVHFICTVAFFWNYLDFCINWLQN
jgi:hypothetical protein